MRPIGNIPAAPAFHLRKHQLAQVLCQIRFSPVLRLRQDDAVIPFQEAIRHAYSRYAKQQGMAVLVTPEGIQHQPAQEGLHRFEDPNGMFTAILSPDFIALEANRYADIDEFVGRVIELAATVHEHYAPAEIQRVGLRFINELRLGTPDPKDEMREAISSVLLGALGSDELLRPISGAQQILEMSGDQSSMLVRHGLQPQGGTSVEHVVIARSPDPELALPFYLLDIDAYSEPNVRYSVEGIEATLREFNEDIRSFFAWAVRESYRRTKLGQSDD